MGLIRENALRKLRHCKMENHVQVTAIYASLLALMFVGLSIRTPSMRRRLKIAIGDAGNSEMLRAMRVHSNLAEYVPLGLLLMLLAARSGTNAMLVQFLGLTLLAGRISRAYGVSLNQENYRFRVAGVAMTFTSLIALSLYLLVTRVIAFGA